MKKSKHIRRLAPLIQFLAVSLVFGQDVSLLRQGAAVERKLGRGEKHSYSIELENNQYFCVTVEQYAIEVALTLYGRGGEKLAEADSPAGKGIEALCWISGRSGRISLEVHAANTNMPTGGYEIRISENRAADPDDIREFEATRLNLRAAKLVFQDAKRRAEQGRADFQYWVGKCYRAGWGVARDEPVAAEWFRKAAQQDNAAAANQLGDMYHGGDGVAKDDAEAVRWFRKAADLGYAAAWTNLGGAYGLGKGVRQDLKESLRWHLKAAEAGQATSQTTVALFYMQGTVVKQNYALAEQWSRKAAAQGDAGAQTLLGYLYQFGLGIRSDYEEAVKWYRLATEQGNDDAKKLLAELDRNRKR